MGDWIPSTLAALRRANAPRRGEIALKLLFLFVPLAIGLAWGTHLDDSAYGAFLAARDLAAGRGPMYDLAVGGQSLLRAPLYTLALSLPAALGVPLPQVSLVLGVLGWWVTVLAIYGVGRAMRRPVAAAVSATLVVFNPIVVASLGTEVSWAAAAAWLAVALSMRGLWSAQVGAVALMLCTHLDLSTLAIAALFLVVQCVARKRFPLSLALVVAIAALGWVLASTWQADPLWPALHPGLSAWWQSIRRLLDESEFYWLFLPWVGLGLFAVRRRVLRAGLLLGAILVLSGGAVSWAVVVTLGLFLVGLGIDQAVGWIGARDVLRLDRLTLAVSLVLVAGLPLGVAQAASLLQRYQLRPVAREALEGEAADWLRTHSEPVAAVFGSARVGYLADRPTFPWDGAGGSRTDLAGLTSHLNETPPEYCVSFGTIAWDHLTRVGWFRDCYAPLQAFGSPYDAASPLTIWGYRCQKYDLGERKPLDLRLPRDVNLVGYRYSPDRIQPGDAVYVTLFLQATQPLTEAFRTVVEVISPKDGVGWAQRNIVAPSGIPIDWWQPGQVIAERIALTTTTGISVGAYHLDFFVLAPGSKRSLPFYQDGSTSALERITLGYVVVPWRGEWGMAKPVGANLGDQISLLGFDAPDALSPGTDLEVTLYWEAQRPPEDDYVVFVHLLDADGHLVANHDGPPMDGRYATRAWRPGEVVPDVHRIALDPAIPVGAYRLQVGMYRWPSLERLPVWDRQGVEQRDRILVLQPVEIR